ncbi:MAG: Nif3-like dinuclear metal center hexameric protein [Burkholderiales bacterium]|nr:Nif3-like dinuclear metal center hexameric protein [Burkholderiales bacterium]
MPLSAAPSVSSATSPLPVDQPGEVSGFALLACLDGLLTPAAFKDYGPNGLQVQGKPQVQHLVTGVTASLALIEAAIAAQADAVLVHHGLFWRGQSGCVTGWMHQRLKALLTHDINLFAYHLPLDAHPQLGNNAQLAGVLGFTPLADGFGRFGEQNMGFLGHTSHGNLGALAAHAEQVLGRNVVCVGNAQRPVHTVAWCTGGAQSYFEAAIAAGADVFITGELSEPQAHYARESGVGYLACGHHATERYGVQAVGQHLARTMGVRHTHIDIDNPA